MTTAEHFMYAGAWLSFGVLHSILASQRAKELLKPTLRSAYRLAYNIVAMFHVGLILVLGHVLLGAQSSPFAYADALGGLAMAARVLGLIVIVVSLTQYDVGRFSGLTPLLRAESSADEEATLHVAGLHRYVRHPLYLGVYIFAWANASGELELATALWISLYLLIGTHFEERRLVARFGDAYVAYREAVPALLPTRGRAI